MKMKFIHQRNIVLCILLCYSSNMAAMNTLYSFLWHLFYVYHVFLEN